MVHDGESDLGLPADGDVLIPALEEENSERFGALEWPSWASQTRDHVALELRKIQTASHTSGGHSRKER